MKIWIDADACPGQIKDLIFSFSERTRVPVTLVANKGMHIPKRHWIDLIVVTQGPDVADEKIIELATKGELVVTRDIPLAAELVKKGVTVVSPEGEEMNEKNIGPKLSIRDFMAELRETADIKSRGAAFSPKDKQKFAGALDRWYARLIKGS